MSKSKKNPSPPGFLTGPQRLNKVLAAAGLGARRQVEELIEQGRVEVDGKVCNEFHLKVDPSITKITVDGQALRKQRAVYFALNKPAGVLCTNRDPHGRTRAIDLVPDAARLFPVGRLDRNSIGLILLTNDGELAQRLAHPKYGVAKSYFVVVQGHLSSEQLARLRRGIYLAEGVARVEGAKIRRVRKGCTELEITLTEGKNREIRRVLARLGHKVMLLRRLAIGPLRLADLGVGMHRPLTPSEVAALYVAADEARRNKKRKADRSEEDSPESSQKQRPKSEAKEAAPKPKRAKPIQKATPDRSLDAELMDDEDDGDEFFFADPNDPAIYQGGLDQEEDEADAFEGEAMVEVSPHWNEHDSSLSKRRGGIIDYEGEGQEDSGGDFLDPFEDAGIDPDEVAEDDAEEDVARPPRGKPQRGRPRPPKKSGRTRSETGSRPIGSRKVGPKGSGSRRTGSDPAGGRSAVKRSDAPRGSGSRTAGGKGPGARGPGARGPGGKGPGARGSGGQGPGARGSAGKGPGGRASASKRFTKGGSTGPQRSGGSRRASGSSASRPSGAGPRGQGGKKGGPRGGKGSKR